MFVDLYSNLLNLLALHLAISSFADRVIVRHYPAKLPLAVWVLKPETAESSAFRMRIPGKTPKKTPMVFGIHILLFFSINYSENLDVAVAIHKYTHTWIHIVYMYNIYYIYTYYINLDFCWEEVQVHPKAWPLSWVRNEPLPKYIRCLRSSASSCATRRRKWTTSSSLAGMAETSNSSRDSDLADLWHLKFDPKPGSEIKTKITTRCIQGWICRPRIDLWMCWHV